jgi:heme d1 biosynthesis radical SAM protein NirJ
MLRVTQIMKELTEPALPRRARANPPAPVVIWNLIRRCNLKCKHCYSISGDVDFPGELSTGEVFAVMDDLKASGVSVLILSGGEPLLRPDIFAISHRAKALGFFVGLSSNGTFIDERTVDTIAGIGYDYVGVSLDGIGSTHDAFRGKPGAFEASLAGIRLCRDRGLKVGLRFTLTLDNAGTFPELLDLMERERIAKFYLSHLNYAGRGNKNRGRDAASALTRWALDRLFQASWRAIEKGEDREFVTGNNDADGVYLWFWINERFPEHADRVRRALVRWGGNSSGVGVANIDNLGNVHPDTFWWHYTLGNVRDRPFSEIWRDNANPILAGLRQRPRPVKGRCARCAHLDICNGNTRVRAFQLTGDPWAEDPACFLSDAEIGIENEGEADRRYLGGKGAQN